MPRPLVLATLALAPIVSAQDAPPGPVPLDPQVVLDDFRAAYRREPVADEVRVTLRAPEGPPRSDRVIIRIDAAGVRADEGPRSIRLELGPLAIWFGDGLVLATHQAEPGAVFRRELAGPITPVTLRDLLPPIPLPQLAALAPDSAALGEPTPYTPGVHWSSGVLNAAAIPPSATVTGSFPGGPVTMTIDAQSGRLRSFSTETGGPTGPLVLELTAQPVEPGDPASWRIDPAGREVVARLADLRTGRTPPILKLSDPVPDVTLLGPDLTAWSLHEALTSAAQDHPDQPEPPTVLILFRDEGADAVADASAAHAALKELANPGDGLPRRMVTAAAAVIDLGSFSRERFQELRRQWSEPAAPGADIPGLLWASSAAQTIDRFSPDARAVAAIITPDRTLRALVILDGRAGDAAALRADLAAALDPPAAPAQGDPPPSGGG